MRENSKTQRDHKLAQIVWWGSKEDLSYHPFMRADYGDRWLEKLIDDVIDYEGNFKTEKSIDIVRRLRQI